MAESVTNRQIYSMLTDVSVSIARVEGRIENVENASAKLMKVVIEGNGKLPLTKRVDDLETRHCAEDADKAQSKKDVKENKAKWGGRAWVFVSGAILFVITQMIGLVILFIRTGAINP